MRYRRGMESNGRVAVAPTMYIFQTTKSKAADVLKSTLDLAHNPDVRVIILVAPDPAALAAAGAPARAKREWPVWYPEWVPCT